MELRSFLVLYGRAIRESRRVALATMVVPLVLPIFMLTIFAQVFSSIASIGSLSGAERYTQYIVPATVVMAAMLGSSTSGISSAMEIQTGFIDRVRASATSMTCNLLARRTADGTRLAAFAAVLTVAAWMAGVRIENWAFALAVAMVLGALWGVSYGGLTLSVCLRTGSIETAQALVPLFFPILFMSTAFVPLDLLPHWLQHVATYNPVSYICDSMRAANAGELAWTSLGKAFLGIAAVGLATQRLVWRAQFRGAES